MHRKKNTSVQPLSLCPKGCCAKDSLSDQGLIRHLGFFGSQSFENPKFTTLKTSFLHSLKEKFPVTYRTPQKTTKIREEILNHINAFWGTWGMQRSLYYLNKALLSGNTPNLPCICMGWSTRAMGNLWKSLVWSRGLLKISVETISTQYPFPCRFACWMAMSPSSIKSCPSNHMSQGKAHKLK